MFPFDTDQDHIRDQIQDPVIMKHQNQENVGQDQEIDLVQDHIRILDRDHVVLIESIRKNQAKRKRRKTVIEVRVVAIMNIVVNQIVKSSLQNIVLD